MSTAGEAKAERDTLARGAKPRPEARARERERPRRAAAAEFVIRVRRPR
jgi:hypothetical protein